MNGDDSGARDRCAATVDGRSKGMIEEILDTGKVNHYNVRSN